MDAMKHLQKLGYTQENGLVPTENWQQHDIAIEFLHLRKAVELGVNAVLFRRKYENDELKNSEPVVYIFERENFINSEEHKDLHAKIWSASEIEVYFILSKTDVHIFNARKPAEIVANDLNLHSLSLASEVLTKFNDFRFSTFLFQSGTFWEQESMQNNLDINKSPYAILLDNLKNTRNKLHSSFKVEEQQTLDKLLLLTVLIKFLEDKKDNQGRFALQEKYKDYGVSSFAEILTKDNQGFLCIEFLNDIASTYNGKIFNILSQEEIDLIEKTNLQILADFIKGDIRIKDKQLSIWKQYAFDYLPVELLSAIYENFLGEDANKGVVYTPPFLVNFLIDEVMPLSKAKEYFETNSFKVLDPACGSGVFLVAAYKRMLQWWFINEYHKTGNIPNKFEPEICKTILEQNVFGVDIQKTATQITIFSLTIAYLDILDPKTEWETIKFQDLTKNIFGQDFFVWGATQTEQNFDLVIGNPPFNEGETGKNKSSVKPQEQENVTPENKEKIDVFLEKFKHKNIPKNKLALQFFEGAMVISKKVCLIIPSSIFLYAKDNVTFKYRTKVFTNYSVDKIFDFTHLRRTLFKGMADTPILSLIADNKKNEGKSVEHIVVKCLISSEKKLKFEIDHYDRHFVRHDWACNENLSFIWKTNLLGGGRLFHLIYRLSLLETLKDFIDAQPLWKESRGFERGTGITLRSKDYILEIGEANTPIIERNANIVTSNLKDDFLYQPPFLIIDQTFGAKLKHLPACLISSVNNYTNNSELYYSRDFVGISVPVSQEYLLQNIYNKIIDTKDKTLLNYQLYVIAISSACLVLTETDVNKSELLSMPFPENEDYLQLSKSEQILQHDVLEYYIHLGKSLNEKETGGKLLQPATKEILENFGKAFCDLLNPIYAKNGNSWHSGKYHKVGDFIIYPFGYGINSDSELDFWTNWVDKNSAFTNQEFFENLIIDKQRSVNFIRKIVIQYKHINGYDCVIFIKPNTTRYWLQSIALRDADEVYLELKKAGF